MTREFPITFRPCSQSDLPLLQHWLADPDVARWWREADLGLEALATRYGPMIDGEEPTRGFIFAFAGVDAGFIQAYRIADHHAYARQVEVDPGAVGIDLFIGESTLRGKGWAVPLLAAFLRQVVFGEMDAPVAVIAPEPTNSRAIHVYERTGFHWLKTVHVVDEDNPLDSGDEYVMTLPRVTFEQAVPDAMT